MEIIVEDPTYDVTQNDGFSPEFIKSIATDVNEQFNGCEITETDIGRGADFPALLIALGTAITTVFFLGKKINENLDGWIEISKKVKTLFNKLQRKSRSAFYDEDIATLMVFELIHSENNNINSIVKLLSDTTHIAPFTNRDKSHLDYCAEAIYLHKILVNDSIIYIVVMSSSGVILSKHVVDVEDWMNFYQKNITEIRNNMGSGS